MRSRPHRHVALILLLAALPFAEGRPASNDAPAGDGLEMVSVVHLHTTLSDGAASPLELARSARSAGVDALVITDHFLERVAYAPWPIGNVVGVALSRPSVVTLGLQKYFDEIAAAEREVPGVILLPGLEVTPYARFSGSLLDHSLALEGWHRHLLVLGIEDARSLRDLPVAGNRAGGRFGAWSLLFLLPAAGLAFAIVRFTKTRYREVRVGDYRLRSRRPPVVEGLVGLLCLTVLIAGFPFKVDHFSPVAGDPGVGPYRVLEDRVRELGGVTSWAHPEATAEKEEHGVKVTTLPYPEMVARTDADLFGALPEGIRTLLPPGGTWDEALNDHLMRRRTTAPFALAELDEHRAIGDIDLSILQTVLFVRERTHAGLVEALRAGRMYARWTPERQPPLRLTAWETETPDGRKGLSGDDLVVQGGPLKIRFSVTGGNGAPVTARLVRHGAVIWSARQSPPFEEEIEDRPSGSSYYRLDVEGAYPYRLISNPIFVRTPLGPEERT